MDYFDQCLDLLNQQTMFVLNLEQDKEIEFKVNAYCNPV